MVEILGLNFMLEENPLQGRIFVAEVLKDPKSLGQLEVEIKGMDFKGNDPIVYLSPATGVLISAKKGDQVLCKFDNSIYEGFYIATLVNSELELEVSNLGDYFQIDLHGTKIYGKYDGSEFFIKTTEFEINHNARQTEIKTTNFMKIQAESLALNAGLAGMLNQLTTSHWTGAPLISATPRITSG